MQQDVYHLIEDELEYQEELLIRLKNQKKKYNQQEQNINQTENIIKDMKKYIEIITQSFNIVKNTLLLKKSSYNCEINSITKKVELLKYMLRIDKEKLTESELLSKIISILNNKLSFYNKTNDRNIELKTIEFIDLIENINKLFNNPIIYSTDITSNYYLDMIQLEKNLEVNQETFKSFDEDVFSLKNRIFELIDISKEVKKSGMSMNLSNMIQSIDVEALKRKNDEIKKLCTEFNFTSRKESVNSYEEFQDKNMKMNRNILYSNENLSEDKEKEMDKMIEFSYKSRKEDENLNENIKKIKINTTLRPSNNNEDAMKTSKLAKVLDFTEEDNENKEEENLEIQQKKKDFVNEGIRNMFENDENDDFSELSKQMSMIKNDNSKFSHKEEKDMKITENIEEEQEDNKEIHKSSYTKNDEKSFLNKKTKNQIEITSFHKHESRFTYVNNNSSMKSVNENTIKEEIHKTPKSTKIKLGHFISYSNNFEDKDNNQSELGNIDLVETSNITTSSMVSLKETKQSKLKTTKKRIINVLDELEYYNYKFPKDLNCLIKSTHKEKEEGKVSKCDNHKLSLEGNVIEKYEKYINERLYKPNQKRILKDRNFIKKVLIPIRNIHILEYDDFGKLNLKGVNYKNVSIDFKICFSYSVHNENHIKNERVKVSQMTKTFFDKYSKYFSSVCFNFVLKEKVEGEFHFECWYLSIGGKIKSSLEEFYEEMNKEVKVIYGNINIVNDSLNISTEICNFNFSEDAFFSAFQKNKEIEIDFSIKDLVYDRVFVIESKGFKNKIVFLKKCREILKGDA